MDDSFLFDIPLEPVFEVIEAEVHLLVHVLVEYVADLQLDLLVSFRRFLKVG